MRIVVAVLISSVLAGAQQKPGPSPEEVARLKGLADQVKAALDKGDLEAARKAASDLASGTFRQW